MNAQVETQQEDPIEAALIESAKVVERQIQVWRFIKDFYRPVIEAVRVLGVEPRLSGEVNLNFSGDRHKLAAVVRVLRTHGFSTEYLPPKPNDTNWYAYYKHPACETRVWLNFTSSVCRRVKIGTEMVEQDIYEIRCGEVDEVPAATEVAIVDDLPF